MPTYIIATHNQKKLAELSRILEPLGIEAVTRELSEVEETGDTFAANAFLKAESACRETGMPAIADDSGLMVDALDGRPGIYSARYAGENATDADRNVKLLEELKDVPAEQRTAKFVSAICCVFPDGGQVAAVGECPGHIGFPRRGKTASAMTRCLWWKADALMRNCLPLKKTLSAIAAVRCGCSPSGFGNIWE